MHFAELNSRHDLLIEIVLPVRDLRINVVDHCLLGTGQRVGSMAAHIGEREAIRRQSRFLGQEFVETIFGNGKNFRCEKGRLGTNVRFEFLLGLAGGIFAVLGAEEMQVVFVAGGELLDSVVGPQSFEERGCRVDFALERIELGERFVEVGASGDFGGRRSEVIAGEVGGQGAGNGLRLRLNPAAH